MSESVNEWTSRYRWLEPIAQGGMGQVFLAENKENRNSVCVIKQLRTDSSDGSALATEDRKEAKRLFKREAEILKTLDHPGIVRFFDSYVSSGGQCFLVMDYVSGNNLETILQNYGPFSQEDAIKVAIQICEVLEYLHEKEPPIIYRDLKPSNLMLTPEGQVIFIDFGIAKVFMSKDAATRVVTAGYSPPEQYFGCPELRSDLYALGATLSHLLTGVRPRPLLTSTPSDHRRDLLCSLDELIKKLTSHRPEDRPVSARSVRHSLYRSYQELYPDFEIPEDVFEDEQGPINDQYISQRIMLSGVQAAGTADSSLPAARGPEIEFYDDENMPSAIRRVVEGFQRLSSSRHPSLTSRMDGEWLSEEEDFSTKEESRTFRSGRRGQDTVEVRPRENSSSRLLQSLDRLSDKGDSERETGKKSFWQKLFGWTSKS